MTCINSLIVLMGPRSPADVLAAAAATRPLSAAARTSTCTCPHKLVGRSGRIHALHSSPTSCAEGLYTQGGVMVRTTTRLEPRAPLAARGIAHGGERARCAIPGGVHQARCPDARHRIPRAARSWPTTPSPSPGEQTRHLMLSCSETLMEIRGVARISPS